MGLLDDPLDRHALENLRRSVVMLAPGQKASLDRDRALAILDELVRLQSEQRALAGDLRTILDRLQGVNRHPAG
jgi:hypothetical protein